MKSQRFLYLGLILLPVVSFVTFSVVRADDENEKENEREYTSTPVVAAVTSSTPSSTQKSTSTKTITQTIVLQPAKIVTNTVMEDVQISDTDRDGFPDETDPHPNIAEQLIVNDTNYDGIDDSYELQIP